MAQNEKQSIIQLTDDWLYHKLANLFCEGLHRKYFQIFSNTVSYAATQLCLFRGKVATDNTQTNEDGYVPIKHEWSGGGQDLACGS